MTRWDAIIKYQDMAKKLDLTHEEIWSVIKKDTRYILKKLKELEYSHDK